MGRAKYTNNSGIPLSVAVFLAVDHYDYKPGTISATTLLRPVRQVVLSRRVAPELNVPDLEDLIASRMGTAVHDGVEKAWNNHYKQAMADLGYTPEIIERVKVNPDPTTLKKGDIPVYMEIRSYKEIAGKRVSGKFDFVGDGRLEDFKNTSVFTWINATKDEDYILQGSIYRWLNPDIVTKDTMAIQFFFTDWQRAMTYSNPKYPAKRTMSKQFPLMSMADTENYVVNRIAALDMYMDVPENQIPLCTDKELWRKEPSWKYYKNPANKTRSTKNFDNEPEAIARWQADGCVGEIVKVDGQVVACRYCPAFAACTQKDALIADGSLVIE